MGISQSSLPPAGFYRRGSSRVLRRVHGWNLAVWDGVWARPRGTFRGPKLRSQAGIPPYFTLFRSALAVQLYEALLGALLLLWPLLWSMATTGSMEFYIEHYHYIIVIT